MINFMLGFIFGALVSVIIGCVLLTVLHDALKVDQ